MIQKQPKLDLQLFDEGRRTNYLAQSLRQPSFVIRRGIEVSI
jgi:hypothetical protein